MPATGGVDTSIIETMLRQGFTQAEIAEQMGVTRQAINYHAKKMGWVDPAAQVTELLPWRALTTKERKATPYVMLRNHVEYMLNGGELMSKDARRRLRSWYETRIFEFDMVVEYDPNIPPSPNQKFGGWRYVHRTEQDDNLIIRENSYTKLNKTQKALFRLPKKLPETDR